MVPQISQRQKEFIEEIASKEGFKEFDVEFSTGALKGDGYMGTITVVKIKESSTNRSLHLVLKSAERGEELRKKTPISLAYNRENFMYDVVFRDFANVQKEFKVRQIFDGTPRYFGGLKELGDECLVLENLKESGFKLWNRKVPMDSHHVGAVMTQYGKFHALSYALKKLKLQNFTERINKLHSIFDGRIDDAEMQESTINVMDRAFKAVQGDVAAIAGLKRFLETSNVFFKQTMKIRDRFSVILHGDCWCNNMMFKYEDEKCQKPSKVYLLDWQLSTVGSPVQDLAYFFYVCSSKLCMDNYNSYLKIYYESLTEMLKQFGLNIENFMSFKELQMQWRIYAKYGMYMSFLLTKILLAEQEEAPDLKEITKNNKHMMGLFDGKIANNEEYNKRISIVINHMVKNRFI